MADNSRTVIVDELRSTEKGADVERSVRIRWREGEFRLGITVPADSAGLLEDFSPFLAAMLLPAMRSREDLDLLGPVSARLLRRSDVIQKACRAWDPSLGSCSVSTSGDVAPPARAPGVACFFSRGVDSMFSATVERFEPGPLTHLVYCDDISVATRHDMKVRLEEIVRTRAAAEEIGLPLVVVATNIRTMTDPLISWEDVHGAALASVALMVGGEMGHVVMPSWADFAALGASGSSPLLDLLWSTEWVEIEHDSLVEGRIGKVAWLAVERPELLRHLKVCLRENRPDNCGRCRKCLLTMACLQAVGGLGRAEGFPQEIDLELVRNVRPYSLSQRIAWAQVCAALDGEGANARLRKAILHALRRAARPSPFERARLLAPRLRGKKARLDPSWSPVWPPPEFSRRETSAALSLLREGRPYR
jgi:hypothetical protein